METNLSASNNFQVKRPGILGLSFDLMKATEGKFPMPMKKAESEVSKPMSSRANRAKVNGALELSMRTGTPVKVLKPKSTHFDHVNMYKTIHGSFFNRSQA